MRAETEFLLLLMFIFLFPAIYVHGLKGGFALLGLFATTFLIGGVERG